MTLDEAIIHAKDVAKSRCDECAEEHKQLAKWLEELQAYKQKYENRILERKTDDESMTIQEVIKRLKVSKGIVVAEVNNYDDKNIGDTFDIAMSALEYRLPKKPDYEGDGYDENGNLIYDTWMCPNCGKHYEVDYDDYDFCPNCGQAIDWSDAT